MRHLNKFNTISEYTTAEPTLSIPNLSLIMEDNTVRTVGDDEIIPIEYLQSTGTQYINTKIVVSSNSSVEISGNFTENPSFYATFIGALSGTGSSVKYTQFVAKAPNSKYYIQIGNSSSYVYSSVSDLNKHTFISSIQNNLIKLNIDGTTVQKEFTGELTQNPQLIFTHNGSDISKARIYYCKIWDNDVLVRDFIPVRIGSTGYMFDKVTKKLFGNAGTGNFTLGPDIIPVEYLQSNGTQYINTGIKHVVGQKYQIDLIITGTDTEYRSMIGAANNGDSNNFYLSYRTSGAVTKCWLNNEELTPETVSLFSRAALTIEQSSNNTNLYVNGTRVAIAQCTIYNNPVMIFARNAANSKAIGKVYSFKAWDSNNSLICDFIPVRIGTTGYLFDKVEWKLYANAGTGSFVVGPDNPKIKLTRSR